MSNIGRNDLCHCGSGKKYKKCCIETENNLHNKPATIFHNTDNELVQYSTSYFDLTINPESAFRKIFKMALLKNANEFLDEFNDEIVRDESGIIKSINFPWMKKGNKMHKSWDNTVLGAIFIEDGIVRLETNSIERAEKGTKLLLKSLDGVISFKKRVIESTNEKLKSLKEESANDLEDLRGNDQEMLELPEIQEQIQKMLKDHWDNWFTTPIPMLNDQTPRDAMKTEDGRELLEALLLIYESNSAKYTNKLLKPDIKYLRKELGL